MTDLHNRPSGFLFARALAEALGPDLVVDTGDLSGVGGLPERALLRALAPMPSPRVLAPGNHDSATTLAEMRRLGAVVIDRPRLVEVSGVRVWGYPDPNRSPLFGPPYDPDLCRAAARSTRPPGEEAGPYVVAVHNALMVGDLPPQVRCVLSGHAHSPRVRWREGVLHLRPGSTGGGGPFGGALGAGVVDLEPGSYVPVAAWLVSLEGGRTAVREVPPAHA